MIFESLTPAEKKIIYECLNAAVEYLGDGESVLIIGKNHATIKKVMLCFPHLHDADIGEHGEVPRLISDCLGHFSVRYMNRGWKRMFTVPQSEVLDLSHKWESLNGGESDE